MIQYLPDPIQYPDELSGPFMPPSSCTFPSQIKGPVSWAAARGSKAGVAKLGSLVEPKDDRHRTEPCSSFKVLKLGANEHGVLEEK